MYKHTHRDVVTALNVLKAMLNKVKIVSAVSITRYFCEVYESVEKYGHTCVDDKQPATVAHAARSVVEKLIRAGVF